MSRTFRQFAAAAVAALIGFGVAASACAETITSTAVLNFKTGGAEREVRSNTLTLTVTPSETASTAAFLKPAANGMAGSALPVSGGQCRRADGVFQPMPGDTERQAVASNNAAFHVGDELLFAVTDGDRNIDANVRDHIDVVVSAGDRDIEILRVLETDVNTGVFAGRLPTRSAGEGQGYDCVLAVVPGARVSLEYGDTRDADDVSRTDEPNRLLWTL